MKKRGLAFAVAAMLAVCTLGVGCKNEPKEGDITVYMPDGAPALALAGLMYEDTEEDGVSYRVVDATQIASKVTYKDMDKNADLCVLPLTAATAKLGSGETYQMVGAVTHGNLYMISKNAEVQYNNKEDLESLKGKTVGVLQLASTPGLIFKTVLAKHGVPFNDMTGGGEADENKVNLRLLPSPKDMATMIQEGVDTFVLAEPAVTAQKAGGFVTVGNLQALYGEDGYPQAVLVAKKSLIREKGDWLDSFLADVSESATWVTTADGETIVETVQAHLEDENYATTLKAPLLSSEVVIRCGVRFESVEVCKSKTDAFLTTAKCVDSKTVLPSEDFYWL